MKKEDLMEAIGDIDDDLIEEARNFCKRSFPWKRVLAAAACFAVLLTAVITVLPRTMMDADEKYVEEIDNLYNKSENLKAAQMMEIDTDEMKGETFYHQAQSDLMSLTEKELFAKPSDIFRGEVAGLTYYRVNYNGLLCDYTVAAIRVEEVYRGDLTVGDVANVRIRGIFRPGIWIEDSDTVSAIKNGVTGIFMVNDFVGEVMNDAYFDGGGVITHYFSDGDRFAFLETENGLVFDQSAYPSLKYAKTLEDVALYVKLMTWGKEK